MKKKSDISLGHRHAWTDTQGHSHRVVFDDHVVEKPRATWLALSVVTAIALLIGVVVLVTNQTHEDRPYVGAPNASPDFQVAHEIARQGDYAASAIASGWNDEFFLADKTGVSLFDASGAKLDFWPNASEEEPTAMTFVADEKSVANGLLFVAYGDKVMSMQFSLEQLVPASDPNSATAVAFSQESSEESNAVTRTAQRGALSELETVLVAPGANVRGLACSAERLFVADYQSQRVRRYSLKKIMTAPADEKNVLPDCELGSPDEQLSYPGVKPTFERNFCISYLAETNSLYVVSSGLFRIDAFDAGTGVWRPEQSWNAPPGLPHTFSGAANPIALAVSTNWIATAETGRFNDEKEKRSSALQLFSPSGDWLAEIGGLSSSQLGESFALSLVRSPDAKRLYLLRSDGVVDVLESRP
ncbi:MAG: hypothetical protein IJU03_00705 [Thermoguttaceae bacterium]|nr:hypothetical protein [Thermoguttaceae bacterium]